jgi:hypothetical protein
VGDCKIEKNLGGRFKTGQLGSLQIRPAEVPGTLDVVPGHGLFNQDYNLIFSLKDFIFIPSPLGSLKLCSVQGERSLPVKGQKPKRGRGQGRVARYERSAAKRALIFDSPPEQRLAAYGLDSRVEAISPSKLKKDRVPKAVAAFSRGLLWFWSLLFRHGGFHLRLGPPAPRPAFEDVAVVQEAAQHGGDGRRVTEQLSPVLDWSDDLEQLFCRCRP